MIDKIFYFIGIASSLVILSGITVSITEWIYSRLVERRKKRCSDKCLVLETRLKSHGIFCKVKMEKSLYYTVVNNIHLCFDYYFLYEDHITFSNNGRFTSTVWFKK